MSQPSQVSSTRPVPTVTGVWGLLAKLELVIFLSSIFFLFIDSHFKNILFMINLYAFNICDTLKNNGFVIDFIDFIYVLSSIYVIEI